MSCVAIRGVLQVLACAWLCLACVACGADDDGDGEVTAPRAGADGHGTSGASGTGESTSGAGGSSSSASGEPGTTTPDGGGGGGEGAGESGASADAGAMEPVIVPPRSLRQACLTYFDALYDRLLECGHTTRLPGSENGSASQCPDALFAEGSTFTIDSAFACAETWRAYPCAELARGIWPACDSSGSRKGGETCRFHAQCESAQCLGSTGTGLCLTCLEALPAGSTCDAEGDLCVSGTVCLEGTCRVPPEIEPVELGGPCERDEQCPEYRQRCVDGSGGVLRCQEPAGEGDTCATFFGMHLCDVGLRCNAEGRCQSMPGKGEPCLHDADGGGIWCDASTYCDASDRCAVLPALGQACAAREEVTGLRCDEDARCEAERCVARIGLGQACSTKVPDWAGNCVPGAICQCSDLACMQPGVCKRLVGEGAPCTAEHVQCVVGTTCEAGVCTSVESQGLFDALDCMAP
jgi:hypothetical protein